jgi:hypothetical protein
MQVFPLSEGAFTVDKTKVFVPFDTATENLMQPAWLGSMLVEIQPFAVITSKDVILFDAGLGYNDADGQLQLHNNLGKPASIPIRLPK